MKKTSFVLFLCNQVLIFTKSLRDYAELLLILKPSWNSLMMIILAILLHAQPILELLLEVQYTSNFLYFPNKRINSKLLLTNTLSRSEVFMESIVSLMMAFLIFLTEEDLVVQKNNLFKTWSMESVLWLMLKKLFKSQDITVKLVNSILQKN